MQRPSRLIFRQYPILWPACEDIAPSAFNAAGTSRLIRNGVGVVSRDHVVFAISDDPVNFYDFALLFRDRLACPTALYFDGNVSSLYFAASGRNDDHVPLGPIIAVSANAAPP